MFVSRNVNDDTGFIVFVEVVCQVMPWGLSEILPGGDQGSLGNGFFHCDTAGRACFTAAEAERSSHLTTASGFFQQLEARIKTAQFEIPQSSMKQESSYCNENNYGTMTLLKISGVIRLDEDAETRAQRRADEAASVLASLPKTEDPSAAWAAEEADEDEEDTQARIRASGFDL